ncbi:hypothetical protein EMPS_06164 [Entomortierella parvispora]|uniref:Uncharacterized protein n=1 Tax=Entomortierella parvispora TaxID=205924 RepID=A0A9P3HBT7_9FUNG|nr:hypothetical protein EMPS_06164 [Entomortierella parvispora]
MDAHPPVAYYQPGMQYPNGGAQGGPLTPISMGPMGAGAPGYVTGHGPNSTYDPNAGYNSSVPSGQNHSVSSTPVPPQQQHQQQYQQPYLTQQPYQQQQSLPQQQMYMQQPQQQQPTSQQYQQSYQIQGSTQQLAYPHQLPQSHMQPQIQLQQAQKQQQPQQQIYMSTQPLNSQTQVQPLSYSQGTSQGGYIQQQQQHQLQAQHLQQQLQQQQMQQQQLQQHIQVQQSQQRQQQSVGSSMVQHPMQSSAQQQQMQMHQRQQQQHQQQVQQHRMQGQQSNNDSRNAGTIEVVTNPQTSTLQLAEFASVMVYTLWHTRPNINGASSNAYNVVPHRISVPPSAGPAFKKFCLKVLSATQLSSSVILLSLKYIQKLLKNNPSIHGQQGSEFRLFTVSLMLANKFLDDNTFTNKTWSDVTGISVKEINVMEMEFLNQVQFSLFVSETEYLDWLHSLETWLKQQGQGQGPMSS